MRVSCPSSSSSCLIFFLFFTLPFFLLSIAVVLLDPSPSSWFSSSSLWRWSGGENKEMANKGLHARLEDPRHEEVLSFSSAASPSNQIIDVVTPQQEEEIIEAEVNENSTTSVREKVLSKIEKVELSLARSRFAIREAASSKNKTSPLWDPDYVPTGPIYRNPPVFHRSYLEMEKVLKMFVYPEGDPPLFHDGPCKSIYSTEGRFIHQMEIGNKFRTMDPDEAHLHFLPFSVSKLVSFLYEPDSYDTRAIKQTVREYVDSISSKYPYWNRSLGADHFMLSCHDWGPETTSVNPFLYNTSIRVLCNANTSEGFDPSKDASLPEINFKNDEIKTPIGGPSPSHRPILGFFAGGVHGPIRPVLLEHWQNRDQDLQVYQYLPQNISYEDMMKRSRYCLCPSGYEVASPRIVEAIYMECVPVIISESYVLPFSDVLDWKSFSLSVQVRDIPNLKTILMGIPQRHYIRMQRRLRQVQQHFVTNSPPKRYDLFHMILHSVWLRRLNVRVQSPPNSTYTLL